MQAKSTDPAFDADSLYDRTVDVFFDEFMVDEFGTAQRVYDCAGIEVTDTALLGR